MTDPIVITREIVKRGWSDFEPKLITGLLSGSVAAFLISFVTGAPLHWVISPLQQEFLSVACFFLGGYLTPSAGTAITKRIDKGMNEVEQHTGRTLTTVTGSTPIQSPLPAPAPKGKPLIPETPRGGDPAPAATNLGQDSVTAIINGTAAGTVPADSTPTTVMNPFAQRAASDRYSS